MANEKDVFGIMVRLLVDGETSLFIMLGDEGSITRKGTGAVDSRDGELFIGRTDPAIFQQLRQQIGPELLGWLGQRRQDPQPRGKICELTVMLKYANGEESATAWRYGAESQGPPPGVCQFVIAAVNATNPWFEEFKAGTRAGRD